MRYLLDTNLCIYIAKRKPASVLARFERMKPGDLGMSVITCLELVYGAWKSQPTEANLARIEELRRIIPVPPIDAGVADQYGRLRADLEREGRPIGAYDLLIAAHTLSLGLTLVTNDTRAFARINGLGVENWAVY